MNQENEEKLIFALDIGTRSVIGVVGVQEDDMFRVCCTAREEYQSRVVVDGQIEDIAETARVAGRVKERLEERLGKTLRYVHIAAAGRVLRTLEAANSMAVPEGLAIDADFLSRLTQNAVRQAHEQLSEEEGDQIYFCVGYAVKRYMLDGYQLSSLLDHKGKEAGVNLIATFLPREVVESLYTTMGRIGLTVSGMTLEPIAAMNAIIPEDLRKLNLALCDIGAGTSDIAICAAGAVCGYTMATVAGDEVTEAVMQYCLVDFATAEAIKYRLADGLENNVIYENILGLTMEVPAQELYQQIHPTVEALAATISEKILQGNGGAPAAVFLVGGGSQTPQLRELVARGLGMDPNRVAVGSRVHIKRMVTAEEDLSGPEFATPLGIALTAARNRWGDTFSVAVNGEQLHLMNSWDNSILGILQLAGYRYGQLMGRAGKPLYYQLNGDRRTTRGGLPTPAEILCNSETAALNDLVSPGDAIVFRPAVHGEDAVLQLKDLIRDREDLLWTVNGQPQGPDYYLRDGDIVESRSLEEPVQETEVAPEAAAPVQERPTVQTPPEAPAIPAAPVFSPTPATPVTPLVSVATATAPAASVVRTAPATPAAPAVWATPVTPTPVVRTAPATPAAPATWATPAAPVTPTAPVTPVAQTFQAAPSIPEPPAEQTAPATPEEPEPPTGPWLHVSLNGRTLALEPSADGLPHRFFDLLAYTDIDPKNPKGNIVQLLNGRAASYLEPLHEGDRAEIHWDSERP